MRQKDLISLRDILNRLKVLINKCKIHAVGNKIEIKSNNIDRSKSKIYHSRQFIPSHRKLSNIMNKNEEYSKSPAKQRYDFKLVIKRKGK